MAPIPRLRKFSGPALLSYGFRPFFLFGALYAGAALLAWIPMFEGRLALATALSGPDWHVHEMLFGYVAAVITGFLLTAIPNWTGRLPLNGMPLAALASVWLAGRVAVTWSGVLGWAVAGIIDVSFLLLVLAATATEIIAGKNWRNLRVLGIVGILALANIAFHVEAHFWGTAAYSTRMAIGAAIALLTLVGGRIVPSFTRNWLARENPGRLPTPFDRFDGLSIAVGGLALASWVVAPDWVGSGIALICAGLLHLARLTRWAGDRTLRDRLVLVLHVAYAFVPLGFLLTGASALVPTLSMTAGIHAWTAGAIGTMTLAVMTRATRGHTGRALEAPPTTQFIYAAVIAAAVLRIIAALGGPSSEQMIWAAAACWLAAFWGFCVVYGPMLLMPRRK